MIRLTFDLSGTIGLPSESYSISPSSSSPMTTMGALAIALKYDSYTHRECSNALALGNHWYLIVFLLYVLTHSSTCEAQCSYPSSVFSH